MSFDSFLIASLEFSMYSIMSSANSDSFNSYFPIWISFISFSYMIVLARTSKTMFNKGGKTGIRVLFLILEEMLSICHCWEWCLLWVCHTWPLLCVDMFPMVFPVIMYSCNRRSIRRWSAKELMPLTCGARADSWEPLGQQGDPTSQA